MSSIYWREAWKYGERAFRYCHHDVGHAIGAISIAAAGLGWGAVLMNDVGTESLENLLGLSDQTGPDAEHPDCLLAVFPQGKSTSIPAMKEVFDWKRPEGCPEGLELYQLVTGDARELAAQVSCGQKIASDGCFSLGMIADFERSLRRYGEWFYPRFYWECGVIGQVLYLEAEAMGIRGTGIGCFFDEPVHSVFGFKDLKWQSLYHFTMGGQVEDPRLAQLPAYDNDLFKKGP